MNNKEYILDTTKTLFQTLANMGVTYEEEDLTFDIIENHITEVVKKLTLTDVVKPLKDNRTQSFWDWVKVNSMQLKDDGVFYNGNTYLISDLYRKWKREIEPTL